MKKVIAITNQKGGVGKTTTALSLLGALREKSKKYRLLGIDLDPQGSLAYSAGVDDLEHRSTFYDVLRGDVSMEEAIVETEMGDILPANIDLSMIEREFNETGRECLLRDKLRAVADNYDYIIIDTPPALNTLTLNAYVAAQGLIIPMVPEILSILGIAQIRDTIREVRERHNPDLEILGILLNRCNMRLLLNREVAEMSQDIARSLGTRVFKTQIHTSVSVAESPAHGESVITHAPSSKPARDFKALLNELMRLE